MKWIYLAAILAILAFGFRAFGDTLPAPTPTTSGCVPGHACITSGGTIGTGNGIITSGGTVSGGTTSAGIPDPPPPIVTTTSNPAPDPTGNVGAPTFSTSATNGAALNDPMSGGGLAPVPEPDSRILLLTGAAFLAALRFRRQIRDYLRAW